ncbi:cytochrome P450 [bacterium]|nr:cytochrome P450 [bacterium]
MSRLTARLKIAAPLFIWRMSRDPLGFLQSMHARHGQYVFVHTGDRRLYLTIDPDLVRDVLVTEGLKFSKSRGLEMTKRLLGNGLLTAGRELHLKQRRLVQPAFAKNRMQGYARVILETTQEHLKGWRDGQFLDLSGEMMAITLDIITRTMFGDSIGDRTPLVAQAMNDSLQSFNVGLIPLMPLMVHLPLAANRKFDRAKRQLDSIIYELIEQRRDGEDRGDFLSMLMSATDNGVPMSDEQLRDECMTIFLAGHETTANALSWILALLHQHPDWLEQVREEIDRVGLEDLSALEKCRWVTQEALRLYPPAWVIGRMAREKVEIGGEAIEPGAVFILCSAVAQRQAQFFPEPDRFLPERWRNAESIPKFAYFPFGGGNRVCIGEHFARMESVLVLACVLKHWDFRMLDRMPEPVAGITLKPGGGLPVELRSRSKSG